jgi:hypothetical protein
VEAMKMILSIKAGESGVITHNLSPGSIISAGDLIANLQLKVRVWAGVRVRVTIKFNGNI